MIDLFAIMHRGGPVLWMHHGLSPVPLSAVNTFIHTVLVEVDRGASVLCCMQKNM